MLFLFFCVTTWVFIMPCSRHEPSDLSRLSSEHYVRPSWPIFRFPFSDSSVNIADGPSRHFLFFDISWIDGRQLFIRLLSNFFGCRKREQKTKRLEGDNGCSFLCFFFLLFCFVYFICHFLFYFYVFSLILFHSLIADATVCYWPAICPPLHLQLQAL